MMSDFVFFVCISIISIIMKRYDLIDSLRGLAVISMILYHACWIMNHFGILITSEMMTGTAFMIWQRSICISFITIAGCSFPFGRHHLRMGLILSGIGAMITALTWIFVPEIRIVFGILTFLGAATLLMIPLDKAVGRSDSRSISVAMFVVSTVVFLFTYNINQGYLGFGPGPFISLPKALYKGYVAAFFGFLEPGFFSTDYFSVLPWIFLYTAGYFLNKIVLGTRVEDKVLKKNIPGVSAIGRHSLLIYLIHPIVLYLIFYIMSQSAIL